MRDAVVVARRQLGVLLTRCRHHLGRLTGQQGNIVFDAGPVIGQPPGANAAILGEAGAMGREKRTVFKAFAPNLER